MRLRVAVLSPVMGNAYYGSVIAGVLATVGDAGGRVVVVDTRDAVTSTTQALAAPPYAADTALGCVDGVIATAAAVRPGYLATLRRRGLPVVLAGDTAAGVAVPVVRPDNAGGIREAVRHLLTHGHRRIGFAGHLTHADLQERYDAYRAALREAGVDPDPAWLFEASDNHLAGGRAAAMAVLAARMPVSAIVCGCDLNAIGLVERLQQHGVDVPGDLAVTGFDNQDVAARSLPRLTTIDQHAQEVGSRAAAVLVSMLAGEQPPTAPVLVPVSFLTRESCGCAAPPRSRLDQAYAATGLWYREHASRLEAALDDVHGVSLSLLEHSHEDLAGALDWLRHTPAKAGQLAVFAGGGIDVVARTGAAGDPATGPTRLASSAFPPRELIDCADPARGETTFVVPVRGRGRDWGLLAYVDRVDSESLQVRDLYDHAAALLSVTFEQHELMESLQRSEEPYALAAAAANDGLWDWDVDAETVYYSPRWKRLLGFRDDQIGGGIGEWFGRVHPDDLPALEASLGGHLVSPGAHLELEHRVRTASGEYRWMVCRALPVAAGGEPAHRVVGSLSDIHPRKQLEEQLRRRALYDAVTGLPNRSLFTDRLTLEMAQHRRDPGRGYAVLFVDLDNFKMVNDSLGHHIGDRLLGQVGGRLSRTLRESDTAARLGGDEFALLLHSTDTGSTFAAVQRIQDSLAVPFTVDGHQVSVGASIGIVTSDTGYTSAEDALRDAGLAMHSVKAVDPGGFALFDADMRRGAMARLQLQMELRRALDEAQFELFYQPIVDLQTRTPLGFEALVRWHHPERGLVPPAEFLPLLEETGLMVRLGRWIVAEACRQLAEWQRGLALPLFVAINLSHREFWDDGLLAHLKECLGEHGVDAGSLVLEITEGVIMRKPDAALHIMEQLHAAGFRLHVDDFGTGYSSLQALHRFPVQALKIDRSFIGGLDVERRTTELVHTIVSMGRNLGIDVVAEGIETPGQQEHLRGIGCPSGQGYWFARPVPAREAAELIGRALPEPAAG